MKGRPSSADLQVGGDLFVDGLSGPFKGMVMNAPSAGPAGETQATRPQSIDVFTVICIAMVSYVLAAIIHEGLGHGLTATVLGARDLRLSTAALHFDGESMSPRAARMISIAGPMGGLLIGLLRPHTAIRKAPWE
jgi:hypothetical protein